MEKTISIADKIHGTIQISDFEKSIISTPAFNRLHNILQNSTAFLTYPSNQTKRFAHSLGVMHLGGKMFFHSLVNAEPDVQDEFLDHMNKEIKNLINDKNVKLLLRDRLKHHITQVLKNYSDIKFTDPLYTAYLPAVIKPQHQFAFVLLFQVIRCTALLHDIGHPPFSHIAENSLKNVIENIEDLQGKMDLTPNQESFLNAIKEHSAQYAENKIDLHEQIGNTIANRLLEHVVRTSCRTDTLENAQQQLFRLLVHRFTNYILEEKDKTAHDEHSFYSNMHALVAGPLDCDRLDYVTRDIENSGFNRGAIEYERLISSMKLQKADKIGYVFSFDVRTLSTIDDFFQRRWFLYTNLIYHHRVIKTDALLERAIIRLSLDYLSSTEPDTETQNSELPLTISGLWEAIKEVYSDENYFNALVQWDDSWLLTVLRQQYFSRYKQDSDSKVKDQLEELLSNQKNYSSLIKRTSDFLEIDNACIDVFRTKSDNLKALAEKDNYAFSRNLISSLDKNTETKHLSDGFFLSNMKLMLSLHAYRVENIDVDQEIINIVRSVIVGKKLYKDVIIVTKKLKSGLEKNVPFCMINMKYFHYKKFHVLRMILTKRNTSFPYFLSICQEAMDKNRLVN